MIKITNGMDTIEVTNGAYDSFYARQGYVPVDTEVVMYDVPEEEPGKTEDELFMEAMLEKPISMWSKDEIKRFAHLNDIDLTGTTSAEEARGRVKDFIDAQ